MKKLLLSVAIASALGLAGCGSESISEIKEQAQQENGITQPLSRIVFDPANAKVSVPNDLLFSGTTDGTLTMPGEAVELGQTINYTDPQTAIGALDGWSTVAPFVIDITTPKGVDLDTSTAALPGAVRLFEATTGGSLSPDSECTDQPDVSACKVGRELVYGTEFVTMGSGNSIVVIPAMPLKASQGYLLAVTKVVKDSTNTSIAPSSTYESVRLDVATQPLPLPSQLQLQTLVNSYEDKLEDKGVDVSDVVYSAVFTTQSTDDVFNAAKLMMLPAPNQPVIEPFSAHPYGTTAGDILLALGQVNEDVLASASRANMFTSKLHAPYYLETPTAENCQVADRTQLSPENCPSLFSNFKALGDSPVTVLGALQAGILPMAELVRQYDLQKAAFGRGDFIGDPAQLAGMNFSLGGQPLDSARHLTKFNPIPAMTNDPRTDTLDVLISMPNLAMINAGRAAQDKTLLEKPATGWPVMIYSHGITTTKETMLAFVGSMAEAGVAVVAIDHPLHGSRAAELSLPNGLALPISASDVADTPIGPLAGQATAYLNLASLLTARDNLRQSVLDMLALRLSLNKAYNANPQIADINPLDVSFYGHSLGGITGVTFTASANTPVLPAEVSLNPYEIKAASYLAPGGGIPSFLLESPSFSGTVRTGLMASGSFQSALIDAAAGEGISEANLPGFKVTQPEAYQKLEDAVYAGFSQVFAFAAQTLVDSGDPVNYATTLAKNTAAIHVMEVVGNETNLPDQVVPNKTVGSFLAGTDPLVALAGLKQVGAPSQAGEGETGLKTVARFTDGHHSSILTTAISATTNTPENNLVVLMEMQTQLATFIASGGQSIAITYSSVIAQP